MKYVLIILLGLFSKSLIGKMLPEIIVIPEQQDIIYLAKIIESEAYLEPEEGKKLVALTVLNRAKLKNKNIVQIIMKSHIDKKGKTQYQYDGITLKRFKKPPEKINIELAKYMILHHDQFDQKVLYYYNPDYATDKKFINSLKAKCKLFKKVGNHIFYKKH